MPSNPLATRYRQKAAECLELAGKTVDRAEHIKLLDIANAYIQLAEHASRWPTPEAIPRSQKVSHAPKDAR